MRDNLQYKKHANGKCNIHIIIACHFITVVQCLGEISKQMAKFDFSVNVFPRIKWLVKNFAGKTVEFSTN